MQQKIKIFWIFTLLITLTANSLLLAQPPANPVSPQDQKRIEKVKKDVAKIGVGKTITVSRLDNQDFFGRVTTIGTDEFDIIETDSKQAKSFKFADLKNVREGDGSNAYFGGKRKNRRTRWVVLGAGIAAVFLIPIILMGDDR